MVPTPDVMRDFLEWVSWLASGSAGSPHIKNQQAVAGLLSWIGIVPVSALVMLGGFWVSRTSVRRLLGPPAMPQTVVHIALSVASGFWLIVSSWVVRSFDVAYMGFEISGPELVLYHLCRLSLGVYVGVACILTGEVIAAMALRPHIAFWRGPARFGLYKFFIGASVLSFAGSLLAVAGVLSLPAVLLILLPGALFAPYWVSRDLVPSVVRSLKVTGRSLPGPMVVRGSLLGGLLVAAALMVLVRAVYPGTADNDVWEHYLHYYREVAATGSAGPSEVWYHYYLSKGAGLSFIAAVSGDVFAIPVVSVSFALASACCVYLLGRELMGSSVWALAAAAVALAGYAADATGGAFFKHHVLLAGHVSFFMWCLVRYPCSAEIERRIILLASVPSALFLGYHLIIPSAIIVLALVICFAVLWILKSDSRRLAVMLITAIAIGSFLSMIVNFAATGLLHDNPPNLFWEIADQEKFAGKVGMSGLLYFMFVGYGFGAYEGSVGEWLSQVFRWDFFRSVLSRPMPVVGILSVCLMLISWKRAASRRVFAAVLVPATFLAATAIFAQATQVLSVWRFSIFVVAPMAVLGVALLKAVLDVCTSARARAVLGGIVLVLVTAKAVAKVLDQSGLYRMSSASMYALGVKSTHDVLGGLSSAIGRDSEYKFIHYARTHIAADKRILMLSSTYGPAHAFPGPGLISEPTYSLGRGVRDIVYGSAGDAERALKYVGIEYFLLNLTPEEYGSFFSSVMSGPLFAPEEVARRLEIVAAYDGIYLLTWASPPGSRPMPDDFLVMLELRRNAVFNVKYWRNLQNTVSVCAKQLTGAVVGAPGERELDSEATACGEPDSFVARLIQSISLDIAQHTLTEPARLPVDRVSQGIRDKLPNRLKEVLARMNQTRGQGNSTPEAAEQVLRKDLLEEIRDVLLDELRSQFGSRAANALANFEDYYPFGALYRSQFANHLLDQLYGSAR